MLQLKIELNGFGITSKVALDVATGFEFDVLLSTEKLLNLSCGCSEHLEAAKDGAPGKDFARSFLEKVREMKAAAASFCIMPPVAPPAINTGSGEGKGRVPRRQNKTSIDCSGVETQHPDGYGLEVRPPPGPRAPGRQCLVSGNFSRTAKEDLQKFDRGRSMSPTDVLLCKTQSGPHDLGVIDCRPPSSKSIPMPTAPEKPVNAAMSFIRRRLLGHRELAVAALAELPVLDSDSEAGTSSDDDSGEDSESDCSDAD